MSEASELLSPLGFRLTQSGASWDVAVPTYRATGDIGIEADVVEGDGRTIGTL